MDNGASSSLSKEPSEEEFCLALRNGLILCNVLNRVNPGAVVKVVDNAVVDNVAVQSSEGPAQSAIQYFENMRNFLEAVNDMKLLTFEASDLEKVTMTLLSFHVKILTLLYFVNGVEFWSTDTLISYLFGYFTYGYVYMSNAWISRNIVSFMNQRWKLFLFVDNRIGSDLWLEWFIVGKTT